MRSISTAVCDLKRDVQLVLLLSAMGTVSACGGGTQGNKSPAPPAKVTYAFTDVDCGSNTIVTSIDTNGDVLGNSDSGSFIYKNATCQPVAYPGASQTIAEGMNNLGLIVGTANNSTSGAFGFEYDPATGYTPLSLPSQCGGNTMCTVSPYAINDNGEIVGEFDTFNSSTNQSQQQGFLLDVGVYTMLSYNSQPTLARGINKAGLISGQTTDPITSLEMDFTYSQSNGFALVKLPQGAVEAEDQNLGINDYGQMSTTFRTTGASVNYIYDSTTSTFSTFPDDPLAAPGTTIPNAVNDNGTVVGCYTRPGGSVTCTGFIATRIP